jgi:hypothetical protein
MAVTKTVMKNTNQETIVKVTGTAAAATITLNSDCLASTQALTAGGTPTANIVGVMVTGLLSSSVTIARNSATVLSFAAENASNFNFEGNGFVETTANTSDIVVTIAGAEATAYVTIRKIAGYSSKVETAVYGAYDDVTRVGASTTLSGSPDKV